MGDDNDRGDTVLAEQVSHFSQEPLPAPDIIDDDKYRNSHNCRQAKQKDGDYISIKQSLSHRSQDFSVQISSARVVTRLMKIARVLLH